jgi:membrane-bound metal-dependent hydrolase YbcI (DUF457 family)
VTAQLAGGHRQGTHSVLGLLIVSAASVGVMLIGGAAVGLELSFLAALALAAVSVKFSRVTLIHTLLCLVAGVVLTGLSIWQQIPVVVLPLAVAVGVGAHVVGDCLTEEGCPLLWPAPWRVSLLPLQTEGPVERYLVGPGLGLAAALLVWQLTDWTAVQPILDHLTSGLAVTVAAMRDAWPR